MFPPHITRAPSPRDAKRARRPGNPAISWFDLALHADSLAEPALSFVGSRNVYLSPHHDDVCFSLGGLAAQQPGGRLVNLFTRSKNSYNPPAGPNADVDIVTRRRVEEDTAFAAVCGLSRIDLGLADAPLMGRSAWDLNHLADDRAALKGPLLSCLRDIAKTLAGEPLTLFCPAGIGAHANHIATMQTVVELLPAIRQDYRVLFYEDLHYASNAGKREEGLLRLLAHLGGRRGRRITIALGELAKAKLALIRLYVSQFEELPESTKRFSPAVAGNGQIHEAVWDFGLDQTSTSESGAPGGRFGAPDSSA